MPNCTCLLLFGCRGPTRFRRSTGASSPAQGLQGRGGGGLRKELTEWRSVAVTVGLARRDRAQEEGLREGLVGGSHEQGGPTGNERGDDRRLKEGRRGASLRTSEAAEEAARFRAPPAPDLDGKHDKAAPLGAQQLRVGALLPAPGLAQGGPVNAASVSAGLAGSGESEPPKGTSVKGPTTEGRPEGQ